MIQDSLGWELDAGKAVTNANVFVALNVQFRSVVGSRAMFFSCYEGASSQMEDWDRKLLVVTLHDAVSSPDLARRLS